MREDDIKKWLKELPGARRGGDGIIFDLPDGTEAYATNVLPYYPEFTPDEMLLIFHCAKNEVIRLRQIRTAHDYLLRVRATAIAHSARWARVMSFRRRVSEERGQTWTLTGYYDSIN